MIDRPKARKALLTAILLAPAVFSLARAAETISDKSEAPPAAEKSGSNAAKPAAEAPWSEERLTGLVKDLSDDRFSVRERAAQDLSEAPPAMVDKMIKAARDSEDPEVQKGLIDASRKIFMAKLVKNLAEWKVGHGFLGISWGMSEDPPGISVSQVIADTGAEKAGVKAGDVIVKIDKQEIGEGFSSEDAVKIWKAMSPGDPMKLEIRRDGETVHLDVTVGEMPEAYREPEGDQTENEDRAEALWKKYLKGDLKVPEHLLQPGAKASPTTVSKPVGTTTESKPAEAIPPSASAPAPKP